MTRDEAKFILSAYRPGNADRGDPVFAEALALARQDPELAAWFAREQLHDQAISSKLAEVPAPAGLREAILAGARASGGTVSRLGWYSAALLAAAAALALIFTLHARKSLPPSVVAPPVRSQLLGLESFVVNDALMAGGPHQGQWGSLALDLHRQLHNPEARLRSEVTVDFDAMCASGARKLSFDGHEVVEVCFMRPDTELWYHLYILRRSDFPNLTAPENKDYTKGELEGVGFVYWHDAHNHYIAAGPGDADIEKHLF